MTKKKIIFLAIPVVIILAGGFMFWANEGFTPKARYTNCMKDCYAIVLSESSKQYCPGQCTENTKFQPTAAEINEVIAKITHKKTNTNKSTAKNTNAAKNINAVLNVNKTTNANASNVDPESRQYYCQWSWPQKIIDKDSQEVIKECSSDEPWCFYADYTYEKVACCQEAEHINCTTLINLE